MVYLNNAFLWDANIGLTLPFPELDCTCPGFTTPAIESFPARKRPAHNVPEDSVLVQAKQYLPAIQVALAPLTGVSENPKLHKHQGAGLWKARVRAAERDACFSLQEAACSILMPS